MKVLVVGNGAREHALAKKLHADGAELVSAMSKRNPGIAALSKRVEIIDIDKADDYDRFKGVDIAFVGPEAPLAAGIADRLSDSASPSSGRRKASPASSGARATPGSSYRRVVSPGTPSSGSVGTSSR